MVMTTIGENIARAMVLGSLKGIPEESYFIFSTLGLAHVLCASGFHLYLLQRWLQFIVSLAQSFFSLCFPSYTFQIFSPLLRPTLSMLALFYFCKDLGFSKPITRALCASVLCLCAEISSRKIHPIFVLIVSALCSWFIGKGGLLSFSLSFLAIAALNYYPHCAWAQKNKITKIFYFLVAPWFATMPIVIFAFHQFSIISLLSNFLLTPWIIGGVLYPGFFAYCLEKFSQSWAFFFWKFAGEQANLLYLVMSWMHYKLPCALWLEPWQWISCCLLLVPIFWKVKKIGFILVVSTAIFLFCSIPNFSVAILNVGQGDSIYFNNDTAGFLIDFGNKGFAPFPSKASYAMAGIASSKLRGALLTHPDADHAAGLESILYRYQFTDDAFLWVTKNQILFPSFLKVLRIAERAQIPIKIMDEDVSYPYPGLVCFDIDMKKTSTNNTSPLCKFKNKILLTGDMDSKKEKKFVEKFPEFLAAEYLKLGHHGSKNSSSELFLDYVHAKYAIISAGKKNRYNHPNPQTMERITQRNMGVLRTDQSKGNIYIP